MGAKFTSKAVLWIILLHLSVLAGLVIFRQDQQIKLLKNSLPFLALGEKISYFDLLDEKQVKIDKEAIHRGKISLVYIFQRPCSPCDKNIILLNKLIGQFAGKVEVYGVVIAGFQEFINQVDNLKANFKLYYPEDPERFLARFRLKTNLSQLLVYSDRVTYLALGELDNADILTLIDFMRKEIAKYD